MGNRIFNGFLILVFSALLWLIPVTSLTNDFQTDITENDFYVATGEGTTNTTVSLTDSIYDNDTSTLTVSSDLTTDIPTYVSYNTTTRATVFNGLTANTSRTLTVTYDTDALNSDNWSSLLSRIPLIWMIIIICFPLAGLVSILFIKD